MVVLTAPPVLPAAELQTRVVMPRRRRVKSGAARLPLRHGDKPHGTIRRLHRPKSAAAGRTKPKELATRWPAGFGNTRHQRSPPPPRRSKSSLNISGTNSSQQDTPLQRSAAVPVAGRINPDRMFRSRPASAPARRDLTVAAPLRSMELPLPTHLLEEDTRHDRPSSSFSSSSFTSSPFRTAQSYNNRIAAAPPRSAPPPLDATWPEVDGIDGGIDGGGHGGGHSNQGEGGGDGNGDSDALFLGPVFTPNTKNLRRALQSCSNVSVASAFEHGVGGVGSVGGVIGAGTATSPGAGAGARRRPESAHSGASRGGSSRAELRRCFREMNQYVMSTPRNPAAMARQMETGGGEGVRSGGRARRRPGTAGARRRDGGTPSSGLSRVARKNGPEATVGSYKGGRDGPDFSPWGGGGEGQDHGDSIEDDAMGLGSRDPGWQRQQERQQKQKLRRGAVRKRVIQSKSHSRQSSSLVAKDPLRNSAFMVRAGLGGVGIDLGELNTRGSASGWTTASFSAPFSDAKSPSTAGTRKSPFHTRQLSTTMRQRMGGH